MNYPGRVLQIGEGDANLVTTIAARLAARGYRSASPPGVFDAAFQSLIKLYQSQNVDLAGRPLKSDGRVGPLTWGALFSAPAPPVQSAGLAGSALARARTQIGVREHPLGSNKGPEVDSYLASVDLDPGAFWCMAFVNWCFQKGGADAQLHNSFPKTGGCLEAWRMVKAAAPQRLIAKAAAIANPALVKPGVVFILDHGGGNGHTGFVTEQVGGALRTIEGNSNDDGSSNGLGVFALNRRSVMDDDLKGFLDFTA